MSLTFVEYGVIAAIIGIILLIVFTSPQKTSDTIEAAPFFSTVEYNGHTFIQNYGGESIVHNPDCTNSKCFKE